MSVQHAPAYLLCQYKQAAHKYGQRDHREPGKSANILGYLALMQVEPRYGLLQPRGGLLTLGISFAIAWAGILAATRDDLPLQRRFQYAAAAWIWLLLQSFGLGYIYWNAVSS